MCMMTEKNNDIFAIYCFFQYFCRNKKLFVTIKFIKGIMKINKTIIVSIVGLMTSAGAFGENNSMPDRTGVKDFCSVISQYDKTGDSKPFVHFFTTMWPKLNTVDGREALVNIHQLAMEEESGGYGAAYVGKEDALARLLELLNKMGITGDDLTKMLEYMEKVYPLYVFQIENRVRPSVDYDNGLVVDTIYQAPVDEAYYGLANEKNKYVPTGLSVQELEEVESNGGRGKRNGSYVWGMGTYKDKLFWSTNNNYLCMQGYGNFVQPGVGDNVPYENSCWACEYGQSAYAKEAYPDGDENSKYADIRPPRMYSYDTKSGIVTDITPSMDEYPVLKNCQGLRSCGIHKGVVFFGGPGLYASDWDSRVSAAFVAYDADSDRILGVSSMSDVDGCKVVNVRRWRVINDVLYVTVGITHPTTGKKIGALLRWYGDKKDPWNFHIVGLVDNEAAELAYFNNRIYIGTWGTVSAVHVSPELPKEGFTPVGIDSDMWPEVWTSDAAEPSNTLGRSLTSVAGFHEWRNHLYWGVFCPNYYVLSMAQATYGSLTSPDALAFILGNYRTPSFWRLDKDNSYEMLYGDTTNPKPVYDKDGKIEKWELEPNGLSAKWGRGGFGNLWSIYIWAIQEYDDNLYVGTMDLSNLAVAAGSNILGDVGFATLAKLLTGLDASDEGFELLRMTDEDEAPKFITQNGFNNAEQYGVRNLEVLNGKLMLGSASMSSLKPNGGWHVLSLADARTPASVSQSSIKKPGIIMERNAEYINLATVGGERITCIEVYDAIGRKINSARPDSHLASIPLQNIKGVHIIKITSEKGEWEVKADL